MGIVALLNGGVERIHIHMDDLPVHKDKYNGNLLHIKGKGKLSAHPVQDVHGVPALFHLPKPPAISLLSQDTFADHLGTDHRHGEACTYIKPTDR
jgi:uncharacterized Fe-S cluster protein YjdI